MKAWNEPADNTSIDKAKQALEKNGIIVTVVENGEKAKETVFAMLPKDAAVMDMTSRTLDTIGFTKEIRESGQYHLIKDKLMQMDRATQSDEMQKLGSAPAWAVGSVHAVTEDGKVIIASKTGSQLPAYAYGASHVVWVVGSQKIVSNLEEGMKRIYEYVLPLESERVQKAYGIPASSVNKLLIFNKEEIPQRISMILVKEALGF